MATIARPCLHGISSPGRSRPGVAPAVAVVDDGVLSWELVTLNQRDMRWKKFFTGSGVNRRGYLCRAPSCRACHERANCFAASDLCSGCSTQNRHSGGFCYGAFGFVPGRFWSFAAGRFSTLGNWWHVMKSE